MDNLNQQTPPSKPFPSSLPKQTALSSPPPPNPSKAFIILLLVMLIIIVGVGAYTLGIKHGKTIVQNQQTTASPTVSQPSPTPIYKTANWKTYTNTKYNYSIKYPPDWIIEVDGVVVWQDNVPNPELGKQIFFFKSSVYEPYIVVLPYPNPKQLSLKNHLIEEILKPIDFPTGDPKEQVNKMKPVTIPTVDEALEENDTSGSPVVYLRKGSMTIMLALNYGDNPDTTTKTFAKQTFDQILSTFKFLDENTISWEEAVELIRSCQVKMASQTHSRNVDLTLKDGTIRITVEPKLDMVIEEAQSASTKCGFDISVETE